jgi:hypothetical protein
MFYARAANGKVDLIMGREYKKIHLLWDYLYELRGRREILNA